MTNKNHRFHLKGNVSSKAKRSIEMKMSKTKLRRTLEGFAFIAGFCGIAFEYTFSKFSADLLGSSAQQWAIVIGIMLFAMGIGSDHQRRIKNDRLLVHFFSYELVLSAVGGLGPLLLLWVFALERMYYFSTLFVLVFVVGFLIGTEIPILARLNAQQRSKLSDNLASVFRVEYVGAFVGAMVWAFFIVKFFENMLQAALAIAFLNLCSAATMAWVFGLLKSSNPKKTIAKKRELPPTRRWWKLFVPSRAVLILGAFLLTTAMLAVAWAKLPEFKSYYEQQLFRDRVVASHSTAYQHIVLTESRFGIVNLYINGQLQFSSLDEYIYHETLVHPAMLAAQSRKRVLILGGGDGLALREVLKYDDVEKVVLVDIDLAMLTLATENPRLIKLNEGSLQSPVLQLRQAQVAQTQSTTSQVVRTFFWNDFTQFPIKRQGSVAEMVQVHPLEATAFIERISEEEKFDVVIIDFPDPQTVELAKLYSLSFYASLYRVLTPGGVFAQQATSSFLTQETFQLIGQTMRRAGWETIPMRVGIPSFGEWGFWLARQNRSSVKKTVNAKHEWQDGVVLGELLGKRLTAHLNKADEKIIKGSGKNRESQFDRAPLPPLSRLRYLSPQILPSLFLFPPEKISQQEKPESYNTVLNQLVWKTYLRESKRY